jgi:hypothetical protein
VGGRDVLLEQLAHLRLTAERPNVELHIIPFTAGAHLGLWELYTIMTIPGSALTEETETVVYREAGDSEHLVRDDKARIDQYEDGFRKVMAQTLDREKTRHHIDLIRDQVEGSPPLER